MTGLMNDAVKLDFLPKDYDINKILPTVNKMYKMSFIDTAATATFQ